MMMMLSSAPLFAFRSARDWYTGWRCWCLPVHYLSTSLPPDEASSETSRTPNIIHGTFPPPPIHTHSYIYSAAVTPIWPSFCVFPPHQPHRQLTHPPQRPEIERHHPTLSGQGEGQGQAAETRLYTCIRRLPRPLQISIPRISRSRVGSKRSDIS